MKADAVFQGGGVKGLAFIGALQVMEERGYKWNNLAGTSAGSIVAALLSAGYTSGELYDIFQEFNYSRFLNQTAFRRIPLIATSFRLLFKKGMYSTVALEQFIAQLLKVKGVQTFGDLPVGKLKIIASDVSAGRMLVLPDDLNKFGINPDFFSIARACRMSSSIPYFFQPFILNSQGRRHFIVDGGLLSNFPIWLFDTKDSPRWPTFGFHLKDDLHGKETKIWGLLSYSKAIVETMLDAHDRLYIKKANAVRTIFIPTYGIKATQFELSKEQRENLYASGQEAAKKFLISWNFRNYIQVFRSGFTKI